MISSFVCLLKAEYRLAIFAGVAENLDLGRLGRTVAHAGYGLEDGQAGRLVKYLQLQTGSGTRHAGENLP